MNLSPSLLLTAFGMVAPTSRSVNAFTLTSSSSGLCLTRSALYKAAFSIILHTLDTSFCMTIKLATFEHRLRRTTDHQRYTLRFNKALRPQ
jgi:hypothetical protein